MPLRITELAWHEDHVQHIAHHHIDPLEVEEVCFSNSCRIETGRGNGGIYYVTGQTENGRYLFIVIRYLGRGKAKIITVRKMDVQEKSRYRKWR